MNDENIYSIHTRMNKLNVGHAMGIRQLKTGLLEFYDPEYGIFTFPSMCHFEAWFGFLYNDNYASEMGGSIKLINMGRQPDHTVTTVPLLTDVSKKDLIINLIKLPIYSLKIKRNPEEPKSEKQALWGSIFKKIYHVLQTTENFTKEGELDASVEEQLKKLRTLATNQFSSNFLGGSLKFDSVSDNGIAAFRLEMLQWSLMIEMDQLIEKVNTGVLGKKVQKILIDPKLSSSTDKLDAMKKITLREKSQVFFKGNREEIKQGKKLMKILQGLDPHDEKLVFSIGIKLRNYKNTIMNKKNKKNKKPIIQRHHKTA